MTPKHLAAYVLALIAGFTLAGAMGCALTDQAAETEARVHALEESLTRYADAVDALARGLAKQETDLQALATALDGIATEAEGLAADTVLFDESIEGKAKQARVAEVAKEAREAHQTVVEMIEDGNAKQTEDLQTWLEGILVDAQDTSKSATETREAAEEADVGKFLQDAAGVALGALGIGTPLAGAGYGVYRWGRKRGEGRPRDKPASRKPEPEDPKPQKPEEPQALSQQDRMMLERTASGKFQAIPRGGGA